MTAQDLNSYQWRSRVLLLFTPTPDDPVFLRQRRLLGEVDIDEIDERNLQMIFITPEGKYENTTLFLDESLSEWYYNRFSVEPYQFEMVLIGLDGYEKFRARNTITPPSVIFDLIDKMPMRRRELLQGYGNKSQIKRENDGKPAKQRY